MRGSVQEVVREVQSVYLWYDWCHLPAEGRDSFLLLPLVCDGNLVTWDYPFSHDCSPSSSSVSCDVWMVSGWPDYSGGRV